jgi:hypothetical protein
MKQAILDRLNELIVVENGDAVTMNSMFMDSNLDSLGTMLAIVDLDTDYPILDDIPDGMGIFEYLDIPNLAVRSLVSKCKMAFENGTN